LPDVIDEIARAGFEGFETFSWELNPFYGREKAFADLLSEKGIQLASIYTYGRYIRFSGSLSGIRSYYWWRWRSMPRIIKLAVVCGCKRIVVGGDQRLSRKTKDKDLVEMAKALNEIGKTCKDSGIEATYHFFYPGYIVKDKTLLERLCELTDPDLVHLTIDNGHLTWAGIDPLDIINVYKNRINVIHLKNLKDGEFLEFGEEGTVDFSEIIRLLKSIEYTDWVIIDNESVSTTIFESASKARKYIEKHLAKE